MELLDQRKRGLQPKITVKKKECLPSKVVDQEMQQKLVMQCLKMKLVSLPLLVVE